MAAAEHEVDICVVGGGPAGMLLANLLSEAGLRTLVVEKSPDFEREFRGEVLQPRFMRAVRQVGLGDFFLGLAHETFDHGRFYWKGEELASFQFQQVDPEVPYVMWMTQPVMLRGLHERARQFPAFDLWFEARAHELLLDGDRVCGVRVRRGDEEIDVRARVVVGADGRFSTMVKLGGFETAYEHYRFDVLWFDIPRPPGVENQISFYLSKDAAYLSIPKYPDLFQIGMLMGVGTFKRFRKIGIEAMRTEIRRAHSWFSQFADELEEFSQFNVLQARLSGRERWARDGLLLIGDAAHTCSPIGAVGVSVAVETAIVAARVILDAPRDSLLGQEVLDRVQELRAPAVRQVHRIQRLVADNMVSTNPLLRAARPWGLRFANATGLLPRVTGALLTQRRPLPLAP